MAGFLALTKNSKAHLCFLAVALLLNGTACSSQNQGTGQVQPVTKGDITQKITVPGTVVPRRKTQITPPYAGYIQKIFVQIGETVSSNTPLVSIAQTLATRGEEVFPLRSPFAGRVVQVMRSEGEYVEPNKSDSTILRIDDLSQLFVEANVPELEYGKLKLGQQVRIKASAASAKVYSGQIRRIAEAALDKKADFGSRTNVEFAVRIQVMDADESLKPGMSALVDVIPASRTGVLTLRHEFLQRDITRLDQATVTLENGETRKVTLGLQNEEMAEITSGLKEGEQVRMVDFKASAGAAMLMPGGGGGRMPRGSVRGH